MACFVISNTLPFVRGCYHSTFFQTTDNTIYRIHEIIFLNELFTATGRYQCRFITNIGDIGSRESRSLASHEFCINTFIYLDRTQMHAEYLFTFV